jgi:hypothetical protein
MKNAERIAKLIIKHELAESILIHTIPGTPHWLICQKIETDKWALSLCHPEKTVVYNLGTVNTNQYIELWKELTMAEVNIRMTQWERINQYKNIIKAFLKKEKKYENLIKNRTNTKHKATKKSNKKQPSRVRNNPKRRTKKL